jgi:hypothetical protein
MSERGAELIRQERERQFGLEGHSAEHDDHLKDGQLSLAGVAYVLVGYNDLAAEGLWPFKAEEYKPKDRLRNLVRAGALIAAEIDRLQRRG